MLSPPTKLLVFDNEYIKNKHWLVTRVVIFQELSLIINWKIQCSYNAKLQTLSTTHQQRVTAVTKQCF